MAYSNHDAAMVAYVLGATYFPPAVSSFVYVVLWSSMSSFQEE
jgi:hypothetical protein